MTPTEQQARYALENAKEAINALAQAMRDIAVPPFGQRHRANHAAIFGSFELATDRIEKARGAYIAAQDALGVPT